MKPEEKRKLAEKLVDLAVIDPVRTPTINGSEIDNNLEKRMREEIRELQIDARIKHYSDEQLSALVTFYDCDLGKSIAQVRNKIYEEFTSGFQLVSDNVLKPSFLPKSKDGPNSDDKFDT